MNRRDLIGRLLAGGAVASPVVIAEAIDNLRLDAADRRLSKLLEHTPPETAVRCLLEVSAEGQASIADFVSALARERNRAARRNAAARRRARHAGNETLYHGPVSLGGLSRPDRQVRTSHRRRVLVGETDRAYSIVGIGVEHVDAVIRDDLGEVVETERVQRCRSIEIPAGSRVLIDLRRQVGPIMNAEVVRTTNGAVRLHLFYRSAPVDGVPPEIRGAVFEFTGSSGPAIGLLGLPI